jgi:hypothetical protein
LEDVVTGRPVSARSASASRVSAGHLAALHYPCSVRQTRPTSAADSTHISQMVN